MTEGSLLQALEDARAERARIEEAWDGYSGNNPEKFHGRRTEAALKVHHLEEACRRAGLMPLTSEEELWARIDAAYPNAASREIVSFEGAYYRRRFSPIAESRSRKTVYAWRKYWEPMKDDSPEVLRLQKKAAKGSVT